MLLTGTGRHSNPGPAPLTPAEAQAIAEGLHKRRVPHFAQIALDLRYGGLRLREAVSLRVGAVNERGGHITLVAGEVAKNGKPRVVTVLSSPGRGFSRELASAAELTRTVVSIDIASYWLSLLSASCGVSGTR